MRRKLADEAGLTLVEMLCATAMLALLGLLLSAGMNMALQSYMEITAESETQLLLSTLADALTDDLRYAQDVQTDDGGRLTTYNSDSFGERTGLAIGGDGQVYAGGRRLLPAGAYRRGAYVVDRLEITYDGSCFAARLRVRAAEGRASAEAALNIRCLNPPPQPQEGEEP